MGLPGAARRGGLALLVLALAAVFAAPGRAATAPRLEASSAESTTPGRNTATLTASQAKGLDVSNWNGVIDWIRVASGGYRFIFGKATEGTTFVDPTYQVNRAGTEGLGMRFGAYHYAKPAGASDAAATANAIAQADHLVDIAQPQAGELPPVLDLEETGGLGAARLQLWTKAWLAEVSARIGVQPLIYSSPNFWKTRLGDTTDFAAAGNRLWVAHWTKNPAPLVPGADWGGLGWTFWQWTNCSTVPGFLHCSDGDRMNGPDPSTVAIAPYPGGAPAPGTAPSVVGQATAGLALAAVPGIWSGGKPVRFTYQWQRCDAAGQNCQPLAGAISEKYVPAAADVGASLDVLVTATGAAGTASATSAPTAVVSAAGTKPGARPAALTQPQIAGTAQVGQVLTANAGTWSGAPTAFAYQWQRCDGSGANCVAVPSATGPQYTPTPDDVGVTIVLVVTATGKGGVTSAASGATAAVAAAPVPAAVPGSAVVQPGAAGAVVTTDGRATVTWQPGAVPDGLTVILEPFAGTLSLPGSEVALGVGGLPPGGFPYPVDLGYAKPQTPGTVLGYSTDGTIYAAVPALATPALSAANTIGSYLASDGTPHVLTRLPVRLALFQKGAWGDPSLSSVKGPQLVRHTPVRALRQADGSVLVVTSLSSASQVRLYGSVLGARNGPIAIFGKGSRLGPWLKPGTSPKTARTEIDRPGGIAVRLRLNGRVLGHGVVYRLRVIAVDPWGRSDVLLEPFRSP